MNPRKPPQDCASLAEIRLEIDRIDRSVVAALGERKRYVMAALNFKTSADAIAAPERVAAMMEARRQWAADEGIDPDVAEKVYRTLVDYFIAEERAHWSGPSR
jgi:isochorismate pyruvate lyase